MITSMRRLNYKCTHSGCNRKAIFEIHSREPATNDRFLAFDKVDFYCREHTPEHAVEWWDWMANT